MKEIVNTINAMVSNPELITSVLRGQNEAECFFIYDQKYIWSILKRVDGEFYLACYPDEQDISGLASIHERAWHYIGPHCIEYTSDQLGIVEAKSSMNELFDIVNAKM